MSKIDPSLCDGAYPTIGHTESDFNNIGFCKCGEFVAHSVDKPCSVIETTNIKESALGVKTCLCQTSSCPCGSIISHKVFEPCTAKN